QAALSGIVSAVAVISFPELAEKADVSDWLEQGGNKKLLLARAEQALRRSTPQETIEPINLWGQFDQPALPSGLLPDVIEQFAHEEGNLTGADPSGFAVAALAVCARPCRITPNCRSRGMIQIGSKRRGFGLG